MRVCLQSLNLCVIHVVFVRSKPRSWACTLVRSSVWCEGFEITPTRVFLSRVVAMVVGVAHLEVRDLGVVGFACIRFCLLSLTWNGYLW